MPGLIRINLLSPSPLALNALPSAEGYEALCEACLSLGSTTAATQAEAIAAHVDSLSEECVSRLCWSLLRSQPCLDPPVGLEGLGRYAQATLFAAVTRLQHEAGAVVSAMGAAVAQSNQARTCVLSVRLSLQGLLEQSAMLLGRGSSGSAGPGEGLGPLAQAAGELGESGEALSEAYSAYALAAGRASAVASGSTGALAAVAATVQALAAQEGPQGGAGAAVHWLVAALAHLRHCVSLCATLCLEMLAGAEALRCVRDSLMTQQHTSVRLLELAAAAHPPTAGGEECPVLLARLCALACTVESADTDWALLDRQFTGAAAQLQPLCAALASWAAQAAQAAHPAAAEQAQALPRVLEGIRKRAAGGALQDRSLKARARAAWERYAAAVQHKAAAAAGLREEAGGQAASSASSALSPGAQPQVTAALHARFAASTIARLFYFTPPVGAQQPAFPSAAPQPCSALLCSLLQLPPQAAPSGPADTLAALAAFPHLLPTLLPPLEASLLPVQAPLVIEPLGKEHWHRWTVPTEQVVALSLPEQQAVTLCAAAVESSSSSSSSGGGLPPQLRALHARVGDALLCVEGSRHALASLPCLLALTALAQQGGAPATASGLEEPVMRTVLASLLLAVCPDSTDCAAVAAAVAQAASPLHCYEAALAAGSALPAPRLCGTRALHPLPSAHSAAEEAAAAAVAEASGFPSPALVRAAMGGAYLARLARAEATMEVPLAEALQVLAAAQANTSALGAFAEHQRTLTGKRRSLLVARPVHGDRDSEVLEQGTAFATARHTALKSTVQQLLEVCDHHTATRLPVLQRAQQLLDTYLPTLTFLNPAVAVLKGFCDALLRAELLCMELTRQCLWHAASLLKVEAQAAPAAQPQPAGRLAPHQLGGGSSSGSSSLGSQRQLGSEGSKDTRSALSAPAVSQNVLQIIAKDIRTRAHVYQASDTRRLPGV